jgi:putative hydrolase of the HAD superfamily
VIAPPGEVRAVISDFGGVLTSPLAGVFARFQEEVGIPPRALGEALGRIDARDGVHPLFELECGRMTEEDFMTVLEDELSAELGRPVSMQTFTDRYWSGLAHNDEMLRFLREVRDAGYRLALLTNNVRAWEPRWRPKWPIDELFEVVVDSAFVGMRKPDHRIYELTLERLGLPAGACVFIDDLAPNIVAAGEVGMHPVHFRETEQAIADVRAALAG